MDLLLKLKMDECKDNKCPFLLGVKLGDFGSFPLVDSLLYRKLVGSLLYITHSRPDLDYAMFFVSRYMQEPHEIHWKAAKRILHCVQGTKHFGIHYATRSLRELVGLPYSDWDGDSIDKKFMLALHLKLSNYGLGRIRKGSCSMKNYTSTPQVI